VVICGVDPGLNITGYGVIRAEGLHVELCEGGAVRPKGRRPLEQRLGDLYRGMCEVLADCSPGVIAVEELYSTYEHPRTAILMGHARGVVYLAAAEAGIPVVGYTATTVKKALTGSGHATKAQMQAMVQRALDLCEPPEPPDVADALALAICHANSLRHGLPDWMRR